MQIRMNKKINKKQAKTKTQAKQTQTKTKQNIIKYKYANKKSSTKHTKQKKN